jgi:glycerol-3-phosphate dehydrogenase subunit C
MAIKQVWPKSNSDVCIRCATCMAICPVSRVTPLFPGPKQAGPGAQRFRKPDEPSVDEWINLCIGCQLCDTVCAAGVNISELNLIAKAKYLDEKGRPFRDWLLTHTHLFGSIASAFSPIVNFFLKNSVVKGLMDAVFKIDQRRELPAYESPTFRQWFRGHPSQGRQKVAYFYGCFTNTNEVDVGKAAVEVLEANGFEVTLPPQQCCGIPMLGIGDFKGAREMGLQNVPPLLETVRSGIQIIFSSTSCGHMIRHEYSHLLNIPGSEEIAQHLFDLFEFFRNLRESGTLNTNFKQLSMKAAYFAPCHLKSLGIGFPALEILRLIPGLMVENIEAQCCGLGGMFGFKKEKYDISEEIGKDLAEAVQRIKPEIVLSDCEGCRMQIRHLTGLKVLHPVQMLRDALSQE